MNWLNIFDETQTEAGATEEEIAQFVSEVCSPLTSSEIAEVNASQINPFPKSHALYNTYKPFDPEYWLIPRKPLPPSYLDFLRWSNGGWCRTGEREFGFFPANDLTGGLRAMLLAYHVPQYMPLALPFAFNGGGVFYLFDMREEGKNGEYPIVSSHAGNIGWEEDLS